MIQNEIVLSRMPGDSSLPIGAVWIHHNRDTDIHLHKFHELVIVFDGAAIHKWGHCEYRISRGDVFLIKPDTLHGYASVRNLEILNILYYPEYLNFPLFDLEAMPGYHAFFKFEPAMREAHEFMGRLHVNTKDLEELHTLASEYAQALQDKKEGFLLQGVSALLRIFLQIARLYRGSSPMDEKSPAGDLLRLGRALSLIQTKYNTELTVAALARSAAMSQSSFYRTFLHALGVTPVEYITRTRLAHASELLAHTSDSIAQIAASSGFADSNYFSRVFRKSFGVAPRLYRKLNS